MSTGPKKSDAKREIKSEVGTWFVVLTSTSIPLVLFLFFFYRWYTEKANFERLTSHFVQRQNTVLAYDSIDVSRHVAELLEGATRDVRSLSLIQPKASSFQAFLRQNDASVTEGRTESGQARMVSRPLYLEAVMLDLGGNERIRVSVDKASLPLRKLGECSPKDLCDRDLREKMVKARPGELRIGKLMRWYSPKGKPENNEGASLTVGLRTAQGIFLLPIDYAHIREVQNMPIFPYDARVNVLTSYEDGNYIYFVDSDLDFLTHPKFWHITGLNPETGERVTPMLTDADEGTHPLNIGAYRGERLKNYFERLQTRSFKQKGVDIFHAPNLRGTNRVLSVSPVLFSRGQFAESGVFGHVIVGCSVEYFEEPKEQFVPYY